MSHLKKYVCLIYIFIFSAALCACDIPVNNTDEIPKPEQYNLSENANCTAVTDYVYDDVGRLYKTIEYSRNKSKLNKKKETFSFYDSQNRLQKTEQYDLDISEYEPYCVVEYQYDGNGGYSETKTIQGNFECQKTYDKGGRLISEVTSSNSDSLYYYYNEDGSLNRVTNKYTNHEIETAACFYDNNGFTSALRHRSGSYYAIWLDSYNEDKNRVSSYWYLALSRDFVNEYSFEEIRSVSVPSYQAHYDNEKLIDAMTDNEWVRTLKANDTYTTSKYEFFDYDENGRVQWYYRIATKSTDFYAVRSIYEADRLVRKVYYTITGDWQHTLYDGSAIRLRRDDAGKLDDITRYDSFGNIMYRYIFEYDFYGKSKLLSYTQNSAGEMVLDWRRAEKKSPEVRGHNNGGTNNNPNSGSDPDMTVYNVKKGDCLWSIAEKFLNDGKRWTEIYENNRDEIGDNPSLIFEGTELKIPGQK